MTDTADVATKLATIRTELSGPDGLVERTDEINLMILCALARVHLLLIGVPGVAKSMVVREFVKRIQGVNYFEVLMAKDTPSEQVLGPISLKALENDVFMRIVEGKMPWARYAFVDEIFKSNSTVLNAFLSILNERIFHNNGGSINVPLDSCIGASNELPGTDREDLMAFRDRFGVTKVVDPVKTDDGFQTILRGQVARNARGGAQPPQFTSITGDELSALQQETTQVTVPDAVLGSLSNLYRKAEQEGLHVSARRFGEGVKLCQGLARLNGRDTVLEDDLPIFQHVLWNDPEDAPTAYQICLEYAGIVAKKAMQYRTQFEPIHDEIQTLKTQIPTDGSIQMPREVAGGFAQAQASLKNLRDRIEKQVDEAQQEGRDTRELDDLLTEIEADHAFVREDVLGMGM